MRFHLDTTVTSVALSNGKATVEAINKAKEKLQLSADKVLIAVGRKPYFDGAVTKDLGLKITERGRVAVDERYRTNVPDLYAIGDIIEGPMLAHKGEDEGVAGVGLTEDLAKQKGIAVKVGKFPFAANGRALANDQSQGFAKILADPKTDKLLGAQIIGFGASELIPEAVTVLEFGGSSEDVGKTVHAHPTMSEAVKEAALAVNNQAFSIPPSPRELRSAAAGAKQ
jgi:dihydrolipoamide dehydrogenase